MSDGRTVSAKLVGQATADQLANLKEQLGPERFRAARFETAAQIFEGMMTSSECPEFLTLIAYDYID